MASPELSQKWVAFIGEIDAMTYDELVARLIRDHGRALQAARQLIETHAPSGLALLRETDPEVSALRE